MQEKISWYEEIISLDPHSKLFFSLAKLYLQNHEPEKAVSTLKAGLEHHPDHFEARLLLHETLQGEERFTEAKGFLDTIVEVLSRYPEVWRHWAEAMEQDGRSDASVALRFLSSHLGREPLSWTEVLLQGLKQAAGAQTASSSGPEGGQGEEERLEVETEGTEEEASSDGREPYRTKTMADVLAAQGDFDQALDIYAELLEGAGSEERREMLQSRIDALRQHKEEAMAAEAQAGRKADSGRGSRRKLVNRLEKLASRLESKA